MGREIIEVPQEALGRYRTNDFDVCIIFLILTKWTQQRMVVDLCKIRFRKVQLLEQGWVS